MGLKANEQDVFKYKNKVYLIPQKMRWTFLITGGFWGGPVSQHLETNSKGFEAAPLILV